LLSSVGSNSSSKNYYIQIKGKLEESIKELNFERTSIIKPSLIVSREVRLIINKLIYRYGLQDRIIRFLFDKFSFLLPLKYHEITSDHLAEVFYLNSIIDDKKGFENLEYNEFQKLLKIK
jgi:hypothetical protein